MTPALALVLAVELGCTGESVIGVHHGPPTHRGEVTPLGGPCDGAAETESDADCLDCRACAVSERCTTETAQCDAQPACVALRDCRQECADDDDCADACSTQWPAGAPYLEAIDDCAQCECMSDCGATEACLGL